MNAQHATAPAMVPTTAPPVTIVARTNTPQDEERQRRIAETEAFLFGGARLLILPGGKNGA